MTKTDKATSRAVDQITALVANLATRIQAIEAQLAGLGRQHEAVEAAKKSWRVWGRTGPDVVLINDAAETATVPLAIAQVLASGRTLDPSIRDDGGDHVQLVQGERVVATLPRAAMAALPRVLAGPESAKYLGSLVSVSRTSSRETGETRRRQTPGKPPSDSVSGQSSLENKRETTTAATTTTSALPDQA